MRLNQIRDLVAIVNAGSMRSAAMCLGVAPPVLTRSVRELEAELGVQLLDRTAHGVTPTAAGKTFLARAHIIQNEMQRIQQETAQHANGGGAITVGVGGPGEYLLPGAVSAFRRQFPATEVRLTGGTYVSLLPQLRDGRLELIVGALPETLDSQFKTVPISREEFVIVARRGHPLAQAKSLAQLADADWLSFWGPFGDCAGAIQSLFEENHLPMPRSIIRCDDGGAFSALLAGTDLIAIGSRQRLRHGPAHDKFQIINVEIRRNSCSSVRLSAYHRADSPLTKPAAALLAAFKSEARRLAVLAAGKEQSFRRSAEVGVTA